MGFTVTDIIPPKKKKQTSKKGTNAGPLSTKKGMKAKRALKNLASGLGQLIDDQTSDNDDSGADDQTVDEVPSKTAKKRGASGDNGIDVQPKKKKEQSPLPKRVTRSQKRQ